MKPHLLKYELIFRKYKSHYSFPDIFHIDVDDGSAIPCKGDRVILPDTAGNVINRVFEYRNIGMRNIVVLYIDTDE